MKKLSLFLMAVAFLCPKVANAQDGKGSINFVPYVGMNYSDFSGDTQDYFGGTSGKVNFMAGARFEFQIAKNLHLLPTSTIVVLVQQQTIMLNSFKIHLICLVISMQKVLMTIMQINIVK